MLSSLIELATQALKLWNSKERDQYLDRVLQLKKAYYEEFNKDPSIRSDAVLCNIEFELRITADAIAARLRESEAQN